MCGLVFFLDYSKNLKEADLDRSTSSISHRGPDDKNTLLFEKENYSIGMGHVRLSIIDLSENGSQPMSFGNYTIVYNGEVYNYKQIKNELIDLGHEFNSSSDTEVVLKSYIEWGENFLKKLKGMFSLVIYNKEEETFFVARDRYGVKPLYIYRSSNKVYIASEIKGMLALDPKLKEINKDSLPFFFRHGYCGFDQTGFKDIKKFKPGSFSTFNIKNKAWEESKFWDLKEESSISDFSYKNFKEILIRSVEHRLESDVPVGLFLSGGIDSSLVAAICARELGVRPDAFNIGFESASFNESNYANDVAKHLGLKSESFLFKSSDVGDLWTDYINCYDDLFADLSSFPLLLLSRETSKSLKVVLTGDGGDEFFIGYQKYYLYRKIARKIEKLPASLKKTASYLLSVLPFEQVNMILPQGMQQRHLETKLEKLRNSLMVNNINEFIETLSSYVNDPKDILSSNIQDNLGVEFLSKIKGLNIETKKIRYYDIHTFLVDDVLQKVDRATMFYGLEAREPLLDDELTRFGFNCPDSIIEKDYGMKGLLKKSLYEYVPEKLFQRPKAGFGVPLFSWLKNDLRSFVEELLDEKFLKEDQNLNSSYILNLKKDFFANKEINAYELWFVIQYQAWKRKWLL